MGMNDLASKLLAAGLVRADEAQDSEEPCAEIQQDQRDVEDGALFVELLGDKRAKQLLAAELPASRGYGYGRAQGALRSAVAKILDQKPLRQAEPLRNRFLATSVLRAGRAADFDEAIEALHEAVVSGASQRWLKEQNRLKAQVADIRWPEPPEWNDNQREYEDVLQEWSKDYSEVQLRAMGFDARRIAEQWAENCRKEQEKRRVALSREAIETFRQTGDFATLQAAEKRLGGLHTGSRSTTSPESVAAESKWAWPLVAQGLVRPDHVQVAPSTQWLAEQTDFDFLVRCAREAKYFDEHDFRPAFREQLLLVLPQMPDETHAYIKGELAITHRGEIIRLETWVWSGEFRRMRVLEEAGRLVSTIPHPKGWVTIRSVKEWNGTRRQATLYAPDNFRALEVAHRCKRGGFDPRPWLANFDVHPQKGFGRFFFSIQPGAASRDHMFISVDDRLRDRLQLLKQLPDPEDVPYADDVWFLPARLASKKDRGGHMSWDERATHSLVPYKRATDGVQMSRRYSGGTVSHRPSGTCAAWTLRASTRKHDAAMVVGLIAQGEELHLDTGLAIRNNGGELVEIPGGALAPEEKPGS